MRCSLRGCSPQCRHSACPDDPPLLRTAAGCCTVDFPDEPGNDKVISSRCRCLASHRHINLRSRTWRETMTAKPEDMNIPENAPITDPEYIAKLLKRDAFLVRWFNYSALARITSKQN